MKSFKEIEEDRKNYHSDGSLNSTHRGSLLIPQIYEAEVGISLLNHFLIKRGLTDVGMRVTGIDIQGKKINSKLISLREAKVYNFDLTNYFEHQAQGYEVEFFSGKNLFIPFPAVIINHKTAKAVNQVHSYNRNLNDVFENDKINSSVQYETSIDIINQDGIETFIVYQSGQFPTKGKITFQLATIEKVYNREINLDVPRYGNKPFRLNELFKDLPLKIKGTLKVKQPYQEMFYGRMLVGQIDQENNFTANHSYYDSSGVLEYWNGELPSFNYYPFLKDYQNKLRFYPIMSPGNINFSISFHGSDGSLLKEMPICELLSPGNKGYEININELIENDSTELQEVVTYGLHARSQKDRLPTRVNHQLVFGKGKLETSINVSLNNCNVYQPKGKKSHIWGQLVLGSNYNSTLAITAIDFHFLPEKEYIIELELYGVSGKLGQKEFSLKKSTTKTFNLKQDFAKEIENISLKNTQYLWYVAKCDSFLINGFVVCENTETHNVTGEHSF